MLDPEGGARVRFELRDTTGATTEITATEPTVPDLVTVTFAEAGSEQITIDDLTAS